jgi:hypothetical protein
MTFYTIGSSYRRLDSPNEILTCMSTNSTHAVLSSTSGVTYQLPLHTRDKVMYKLWPSRLVQLGILGK